MSQLDYNDQSAEALILGAIQDAGFTDKVSAISAAVVEFGKGLALTATEGTMAKPAATGFSFGGVAVQTLKGIPNDTGEAQYEIGEDITVMRKGRVVVYSEVAIDPTQPVFLRHTTNATLVPGDFRNDADTARADDISAFARWVSTTAAAGPAILEINAP